jgi:hypothetical protein
MNKINPRTGRIEYVRPNKTIKRTLDKPSSFVDNKSISTELIVVEEDEEDEVEVQEVQDIKINDTVIQVPKVFKVRNKKKSKKKD